jgi:prepilin-type N-terminal cleavage/methylation domain-containing protein
MRKIKGFTLAEVLITLSIVGVISAMTIPNLVGNASRRGQVALLRKAYVDLTEALDIELTQEDAKNLNHIFDTDAKIQAFFTRHFKVTRNCSANANDCLPASVVNINSNNVSIPNNLNCIINASGTTICLSTISNGQNVFIDVNGPKDPNIKGRDVFGLKYSLKGDLEEFQDIYSQDWLDGKIAEVNADTELTDDAKAELIAEYTAMHNSENGANANNQARCTNATHPYGCFGVLLGNDWVMDY